MKTISEHLDTQARESVEALISQGWTAIGARYDIGTYHGDAEALEARLGRPTTRSDRVALESRIRRLLDEAYSDDAAVGS